MTRQPAAKRIPELDGWRVLMLLLISWYHFWQQSWLSPDIHLGRMTVSLTPYVRVGYMMVDGMILLSSFVLFLPYARHMVYAAPLPRAVPFYARRACRVLPSYYVYLTAMAMLTPFGRYATRGDMWTDLLRHVTFTHTFFTASYLHSPLGMLVWTIGIEVQAYLFFPFLAAAATKKPAVTWPLMTGAAFLYRALVMRNLQDFAMVVNQLPSFLDVYALGMLCAYLYTLIAETAKKKRLLRVLFTLLSVCAVVLIAILLQHQARESGQAAMHIGQMTRRFPLALLLGCLFLSSALGLRPSRAMLNNGGMAFLAGVTLNYYLWHNAVALLLKRWRFPPYTNPLPNQAYEFLWQTRYSYLCFLLSVSLSVLLTHAVEKPCAQALTKLSILKRRSPA